MMKIILERSANYANIFLKSNCIRSTAASNLSLYDFRTWNRRQYESKLYDRSLSTLYPRINLQNNYENIFNTSRLYNEKLIRNFSVKLSQDKSDKPKPNIFQKMKQLTKDYWHILIPVHVATSTIWVVIFYTAVKNGVDVINIMQKIHMPERYIDMIRNSNAGHWVMTYALYKIFTPLRYTVTISGTTMIVRYLDKKGYLRFRRRPTEIIRTGFHRQRQQISPTSAPKTTQLKVVPNMKKVEKEKIKDRI